VWALVFTQAVAVARPRNLVRELQEDLSSGKIAALLLFPISYTSLKITEHYSKLLIHLSYFIVVGLIIGSIFTGHLPPLDSKLLGGLFLLTVWAFVALLWYILMASLGFFMEDARAFMFIYGKLNMIFGGNILPIAFMPLWLSTIAWMTPWMHEGYSAGLFLQSWNGMLFIKILWFQVFWITLLLLLIRLVEKKLRTRLEINGG
jgi:ABC-type uncharacterized transport system permease subunit